LILVNDFVRAKHLWDEHDGLITTFAEFLGTESFEKSVLDLQLVVVYPVK